MPRRISVTRCVADRQPGGAAMTSRNKSSPRRWRGIWSALLLLLTAFPVSRAAAQGLPLCSWPFEVTGHGLTNVATPDTNATYWVMPVDTSRWSTVIVDGRYPNARFFNLSTYQATGTLVDSMDDASIEAASGVNPFDVKLPPPKDKTLNTYRLQISRASASSGNTLGFGASRLQFIVYRVYAADSSYDRTGGAQVPSVTLVAPNGTSRQLRSCPFADADTSLANLILLLRVNGFTDAANFLQGILAAAGQLRFGAGSCTGQPPSPNPVFAPATLGADFFPNPQTTYLETPGFCFQSGKILVVTGRAPVFPDTYNGRTVFDPAPPFEGAPIQLRYWSMCNNDRAIPYPVVACKADIETAIQKFVDPNANSPVFSYTYIVSADPAPARPPGKHKLAAVGRDRHSKEFDLQDYSPSGLLHPDRLLPAGGVLRSGKPSEAVGLLSRQCAH